MLKRLLAIMKGKLPRNRPMAPNRGGPFDGIGRRDARRSAMDAASLASRPACAAKHVVVDDLERRTHARPSVLLNAAPRRLTDIGGELGVLQQPQRRVRHRGCVSRVYE